MQVLYVKWIDSNREAFGWTDPKEAITTIAHCETVGFLFKETDDALSLIQSKGVGAEPDEVLFIINIPKVAILEKEVIFYPSLN